VHVCISKLRFNSRSEGGWKEVKFFPFSAVYGVTCSTVIGDNVTSNKSARVNRVNECLN
jgi:hypothetical protein